METTLFWIGCSLGVYAWVLRQIFKKESWLRRRWGISFLHVVFMAAVGALIGFVASASMDLHGPSPRWSIIGSLIGLSLGGWQCLRKSPMTQGPLQLLADDLEWVETSFSAVLLAAVIMYGVVQAFKIPSGSMENTLHVGDHLFVNKFVYGVRIPLTDRRVWRWKPVRRGDIVVFECPQAALSETERQHHIRKDFIKRAVALAGDEVWVKNKHLYVNGQPQTEPFAIWRDSFVYPTNPPLTQASEYQAAWESGDLARAVVRDNFGPVRVPVNCYFAMGDNRDGSFDSRFWGPLPDRLLKGKAWFIYWPLNRVKVIQ